MGQLERNSEIPATEVGRGDRIQIGDTHRALPIVGPSQNRWAGVASVTIPGYRENVAMRVG
ncbi:hypothetical protein GCM10011610_12190 [Nocardia rhizosphaerihabitans]|uniref:Uncharacterized protein n=1 Tax=Nocardia rhizosphaerihabitans TaxID=1691570 RepID=A0ABQ2K750_9NOCA|nr:hypothetical protein GCM10011610_12190 [Nocardia rhizosphaerihabitans]